MTVVERPAAFEGSIRKIHQEGQRRLPITHGWYCRGTKDADGAWTPEMGLPGDVFVYADMGDTYVREALPDEGFLALSDIPFKKAIANINPEFAVMPPKLALLEEVLAKVKARRPEAIDAIEDEIADLKAAIKEGGLTGGEPQQFRRKIAGLTKRIDQIKDDRNYNAGPIYRSMVEERRAVVRSQIPREQVIALELEKEDRKWGEHLDSLPTG